MTQEQFEELSLYAVKALTQTEIDYTWDIIDENHLYVLPERVEYKMRDAIDDWCMDNDVDPDEWYEIGDIIEVWCTGTSKLQDERDAAEAEMNESFTEERYSSQRPLTNGQALSGIKGLATIMLDYEKYCKAALTDIVNYYKKLGIKVLSAVTGEETSENHSGFVLKLERESVEEYLAKNTTGYDAFDDEEAVDEYKAEDFRDLTINGWQSCGKNAMFLFKTVWTVTQKYRYGDMGKSYYIPEGDLEFKFDSPNTLSIYFDPSVFDCVHDILSQMIDYFTEENILACGEVKS